jgi:hypothetical protein
MREARERTVSHRFAGFEGANFGRVLTAAVAKRPVERRIFGKEAQELTAAKLTTASSSLT